MASTMTRPAYLSPRQIAEGLSMSRRQVYRWINKGELDSVKIGGSRRVSEEQLARKVGKEPARLVFDAVAKAEEK